MKFRSRHTSFNFLIRVGLFSAFTVTFCLFSSYVLAQKADWINQISGGLNQYGHHVVVNQQDEVMVIGSVQDTSNFDPSGTIKPLITNGNYDVFVAKYSKDGKVLWARNFGGDSIDYGNDIALDNIGNIYITGLYRKTMIVPTLTGVDTLISKGVRDCFVIKLNTGGDVVWTKSIGSTGYENGQGIVADSLNNLYLTGYYEDSLELNPGQYLLPTGQFVMFLIKLNANTGNIHWGKTIGGKGEAGNIALGSDGNIYINGSLTQRHLAKFDTSGQFMWNGYRAGRTNFSFRAGGIYADDSGYVYTIGEFTETCSFSGPSKYDLVCGKYNNCVYITKTDTTGNMLWSRKIDGTRVFSSAIVVDKTGRVHIGGSFYGDVDFDPGASIQLHSTKSLGYSYLLSLDQDGDYLAVNTMGDKKWDVAGCGLAVNKSGNIIETGFFSSVLVADSSSPKYRLVSKGGSDGYVLQYNCLPRTDTLFHQICKGDSVVSPSKTKTWYSDGVYLDTTSSITSYCPNVYVASVQVVKFNTMVERTHAGLSSLEEEGSYQWYNCNYNPPLLLPGETKKLISNESLGSSSGDYMVEINKKGCVSRSDCYQMMALSVFEELGTTIHMYPNPANDVVTLQFSEPTNGIVQLLDIHGRLILEKRLFNEVSSKLTIPHQSGMYLVCIRIGNQTIYRKLVKR